MLRGALCFFAVAGLLAACGKVSRSGNPPANGGTSSTGGTAGIGGTSGTSGAGGIGGTSGTGGAPAPDACQKAADKVCSRYEQCSPLGFAQLWGSQAACRDEKTQKCRDEAAAPGSGLTDQHIASCADAITKSCDLLELGYVPQECLTPAGTLPKGAACSLGSQCATHQCLACVCDVGRAVGQPCADPQGNWYDCVFGATCDPPLCAQPAWDGDACKDTGQCEYPLHCINGRCGLEKGGKTEGGPCATGQAWNGKSYDTFQYCQSAAGLYCDTQSTPAVCAKIELRDQGGLCDGERYACKAGLFCLSGVCTPNNPPCTTAADCAAGEYCSLRTCAALPSTSCPH